MFSVLTNSTAILTKAKAVTDHVIISADLGLLCLIVEKLLSLLLASAGLPALYMGLTVPLGFLLNNTRHYGSDSA